MAQLPLKRRPSSDLIPDDVCCRCGRKKDVDADPGLRSGQALRRHDDGRRPMGQSFRPLVLHCRTGGRLAYGRPLSPNSWWRVGV